MAHGRPPCVFCGEPVTHTASAYRRVTGWMPAAQGASGRVSLAAWGEWAHGLCVEAAVSKARHGVSPDQSALDF